MGSPYGQRNPPRLPLPGARGPKEGSSPQTGTVTFSSASRRPTLGSKDLHRDTLSKQSYQGIPQGHVAPSTLLSGTRDPGP